MTIEQLRYEIGAQQRRHAAESAAQQQRITVLEGQLAEAQREADMFHQASVENNAELTALRNQVTDYFVFSCCFNCDCYGLVFIFFLFTILGQTWGRRGARKG